MGHTHTRVSDRDMTTLQTFFRWWKENGVGLMALIGMLMSAALWIFGQTGLTIIGPRYAKGQVNDALATRLTSDSTHFATVISDIVDEHTQMRTDVDSAQREMAYFLRAIEAGNRVTCFRDRPAAEVAGILCPSGRVAR